MTKEKTKLIDQQIRGILNKDTISTAKNGGLVSEFIVFDGEKDWEKMSNDKLKKVAQK